MSQNKTTENNNSVEQFLNTVPEDAKRADSFRIAEIFAAATGLPAKMWGTAIVGFGSYHYKYQSGREGDAPLTGFSPRKNEFALYFSAHFDKREELLSEFGKHKTAKACVYIKKVDDIDVEILKKMIVASVKHISEMYPK